MQRLEYYFIYLFFVLRDATLVSPAFLPMTVCVPRRKRGHGTVAQHILKMKKLKGGRSFANVHLSYSKEDQSEERLSTDILRSRTAEEQTLNGTESTIDNLGDIMTTPVESEEMNTAIPPLLTRNGITEKRKATSGGLKTSSGGSLQARFGVTPPFSALDRIALTANGNLQRIVSSFYDSPVAVVVNNCIERPSYNFSENAGVWDRSVDLKVYNKVSLLFILFNCRLTRSLVITIKGQLIKFIL